MAHFDGGVLPQFPRSDVSVFTHADLTPRNIVVDQGRITGIIDWEDSGLIPNYWEYANIMRPSKDQDWKAWVDATKSD